MDKRRIHQALNRLLTVLERSLPMYLSYASPWTRKGDEQAVATLNRIVDEQKQMAARVADLVLEYGPVDLGEFPIEFLDMHDLALDFLLMKMVELQKRDVATMERCVAALQADRQAAAVAEESLGMARGQLETLEELAAKLDKTGPTWAKS